MPSRRYTEEQRERNRQRERDRRAAQSEEQREQLRQRARDQRASQSEEQREQLRQRARDQRASQSEEQREQRRQRERARRAVQTEALREHRREQERLKSESVSEEQRQEQRRRNRERQRTNRLKTEDRQRTAGVLENCGGSAIDIPLYSTQRDDEPVCDSEVGSDCESLGGDFDTDSEPEEHAAPHDFKRPNDPAVVAAVCKKVNEALSEVCAARCYVCDRFLNDRAVRRVDLQRVKEADRAVVQQLLDKVVTVPGQYDMCATCHSYIMKKQVPPSAAENGFRYPALPPGLEPLTEVEEHVLALRLPFQQIVHLGTMGRRGQYGVRGSVINVPTEPDQTMRTVIPQLPEEDELCVVNIKRKLVHKRAFAHSFVRKDKLLNWGRFLEKSTLYREHGAKFEESRLDELPGDLDSELRSNQDGEVFYGEPDEPEG